MTVLEWIFLYASAKKQFWMFKRAKLFVRVVDLVRWSEERASAVLSVMSQLASSPVETHDALQGYLAHKKTPTPLGPP